MRSLLPLIAGLFLLGSAGMLRAQTTYYEFVSRDSQLDIQGGFAGLNESYAVEGSLVLDVNLAEGTALFSAVNATLQGVGGTFHESSLDSALQMTQMTGEVIDSQTFSFTVLNEGLLTTLDVTKSPGSLTIVGGNEVECCDLFVYDLVAVLVPEPSSMVLASSAILCLLFRFGLSKRDF